MNQYKSLEEILNFFNLQYPLKIAIILTRWGD